VSSAVHSLQKAILDPKQSLTPLFRQTKVIAAKLGLTDMEKWVDLELNGYHGNEQPPKYREFTSQSLDVLHPFRGWETAGHYRVKSRTPQPISTIEELSNSPFLFAPLSPNENLPVDDGIGGSIARQWPQRIRTDTGQFKRILELIRNELLQWTIELDKRGIKGEDMDFNEKEKQAATHQTFNIQKFTGVFGNVTGSQVTVYDYSSVSQLLLDHQVPKAERRELEDLMDDLKTAPPEKKPTLIQKGKDWIVKNKEFLGASAEAVGRAIGAAIDKCKRRLKTVAGGGPIVWHPWVTKQL
jgi:hypothetical protein